MDWNTFQTAENACKRITDHFGGIDVLVNNAGIQHVAALDKFPLDKWNAILAIKLAAGFTKTVALEVAEIGITANAVCPGYVLTPLMEKQIPDTAKARGITEDPSTVAGRPIEARPHFAPE